VLWPQVRAGAAALGLTVPLALLLGPQTGVQAPWLIVSSIVGGAVVALFAGSPLVLAGPGVVTAAAVAALGARQGAGGLALACAACGLLQLVAGVLRLGRFARLVPLPVVAAFVTALGAWVVLLALPHALGLPPAPDLGALEGLDHLLAGRSGFRGSALLMAALAAAATLAGRRFLPRLPTGLVVVALAAAVTGLGGLSLPCLPDLALVFPAPPPLALPSAQPLHFAGAVLTLWVLASAETLLSSAAEPERLPAVARPDLDQDLIGHGLANLTIAFLGGVPATGALIRAEAAGERRGPAAGFGHALLGLPVLVLLPLADRFVPLAALAGVVVAHAAPLLSPRPWRAILSASRGQAAILAATAAAMVLRGLLPGIELGLALSLLAVLLRIGRLRVTLHGASVDPAPLGVHQITFSGPLTFLAAPRLDAVASELAALGPAAVLFDLRDVPTMDYSGARRLASMVGAVIDRGERLALLGLSPACRDLLLGADPRGLIQTRLAVTEADVDQILERPRSFE